MVTNRLMLIALLFATAAAGAREAASPMACQAAAGKPAISAAKAAVANNPNDLNANFNLADAWSDAGCFTDAVLVLQTAQASHPGQPELETRLRVAKSLVGEEHFFDNLERANAQAKFKRQTFRCTTLYDLDACTDALRTKPDDPSLLVAQGDSLLRARRPADAVNRYRLAAVIAPNQRDIVAKIHAAETQLADSPPASPASPALPASPPPPASAALPAPAGSTAHLPPVRMAAASAPAPASVRRYSNAAPDGQSH